MRSPERRTRVEVGMVSAVRSRRAASAFMTRLCRRWRLQGHDRYACGVPNWFYLFFNALYHLGLALWIGGAVALGGLVAPVLFAALPRPQAGAIFGPTLRRFARVRVVALVLIVTGSG